MKKQRRAMMCALGLMGLTVFATPVTFAEDVSISTEAVNGGDVEPKAYIRQWRYKVMYGHVYKRLFNCSTGEWETGWILVQ